MVLRSAPPSSPSGTSCPAPTFYSSYGAGMGPSEKQLLFHVRKDGLSFPIQLAVLDQVKMTVGNAAIQNANLVTSVPKKFNARL
ncbi:hypothetical protein EDB83DRAFT_2532731 [Lactarius deliciosus]|nr:hypothetical protein EDB83DRAFT_2532731 [Lactarius deliciosus]